MFQGNKNSSSQIKSDVFKLPAENDKLMKI